MNDKIEELIDEETIQNRINELAIEISKDYKNEEIVLICILKGSTYFAIDLSKKLINNDVILDFMKVSSYGNNLETTGKINFSLDTSIDIKNKNVIIVEDIIDTGLTLNFLYNYLKNKDPKTLKICALLDKKERRQKNIHIDYTGFQIKNKFVVGYGLDFDEKYRNLSYIGYIGD